MLGPKGILSPFSNEFNKAIGMTKKICIRVYHEICILQYTYV